MRDPLATGPRGAVLLTGASGFLGAQVARRLLACTDHTIYALIRAADSTSAAHRLSRAWWDWPELAGAIGNRVQVLAGDVGQARLGLSEDDYAGLAAGLTHIVHTAADLRVNAPIAELRKTNLQGTGHVLELAQAAQADHGLARYAHVSTAYVAGGRTGPVPEDALTDAYGFSCAYEFSKYEGERLVQAARADLPISVFRPGMIVGDSATGEIRTFNTLYFPLRLYLEGRLPLMPASRTQPVNLVPVDYVADAIVRLTLAPEAAGLNFHLTAPYATLPQIGELVAFGRAWAREQLGLRLPRPVFLPLPLPRGRYDPERPAPREEGMLACPAHAPPVLQRAPRVPAGQRRPPAGALSSRLAGVPASPSGLRRRCGFHAPLRAHRARADPLPPEQHEPADHLPRHRRQRNRDPLGAGGATGRSGGDGSLEEPGHRSRRPGGDRGDKQHALPDARRGHRHAGRGQRPGLLHQPAGRHRSHPGVQRRAPALCGLQPGAGTPRRAGLGRPGHLLRQRPRPRRSGSGSGPGRRAARHGLGGVPGAGPPTAARSQAAFAGGLRRPGDAALHLGHHRPAQGRDVPARRPALDGRDHGGAPALASCARGAPATCPFCP